MTVAGLDVDQMIVMRVRRRLIARAAVAELVALEDPSLLEQADRPVHGGNRDFRIDRRGALVKRLDVGMVLGLGQDPGDGPPLLGNPQPLGVTQGLDVDGTLHAA